MKKEYLLVIVLGVIIVILLGALAFLPKPTERPETKSDIIISSVLRQDNGFADIVIEGLINGGGWIAFEGQAGVVKFLDKDNKSLGYSLLKVVGDWMINPPIPFEATMRMTPEEADAVVNLEFTNENPSGIPENNKKFIMPVKLVSSGETMQVLVFFNGAGPGNECENVIGSTRIIPKTTAVARAALEQLLLGTTNQDGDTLSTSINPGVKINSLVINNAGIAKVDFNDQLQFQVGGSCRVAAIRAQITKTLLQFPTIKKVIISINGKTEDILQP